MSEGERLQLRIVFQAVRKQFHHVVFVDSPVHCELAQIAHMCLLVLAERYVGHDGGLRELQSDVLEETATWSPFKHAIILQNGRKTDTNKYTLFL